MRKARILIVGAIFLAGAHHAFGQTIDTPNGSGKVIQSDTQNGTFRQNVYTTNDVYVALEVFHNGVSKWFGDALIITSGPVIEVTADIPFGSFGMRPGDGIDFDFTVRHIAGPYYGLCTYDWSWHPVVMLFRSDGSRAPQGRSGPAYARLEEAALDA